MSTTTSEHRRTGRHVVTVLAAMALVAACSGPDAARPILDPSTPEVSAPPKVTDVETSDAPTTSQAPSDSDDGIRWSITDSPETGVLTMVVADSSGRNITLDPSTEPSTNVAITMAMRSIYVKMRLPLGADGSPDLVTAHPLILQGMPREGPEPVNCLLERPDVITVCIGFPQLDQRGSMNYADAANQPGDVSRVLDVILDNPDTFGIVDDHHIVYTGGSIGGITGLWFVHPLAHDPRLTAIAVTASFAPYWIPAFGDPANWDFGPQILMVNGSEDTTITYELARKTVEAAGGAKQLTIVTVIGADHGAPFGNCGTASAFYAAWMEAALTGSPAPSPDAVTTSGCSVLGLIDGGTSGPGSAAPFIPAL